MKTVTTVSAYEQRANDFAKKYGITLIVHDPTFKKHFSDDTQQRYVFPCTLKRGRKSYSFQFGQSIADGNKKPTMYDILACLTKYDVGSYNDFCGEFGISGMKEYKAVCEEYAAVERLFGDIMEELQEIK